MNTCFLTFYCDTYSTPILIFIYFLLIMQAIDFAWWLCVMYNKFIDTFHTNISKPLCNLEAVNKVCGTIKVTYIQ